jgi:small-conductance mechanosensitive channel
MLFKDLCMKWIIFIVLFTSILFSAEIDVNLYEGPDREAYYQKIDDQIDTASKKGLHSEDIIQEEKLYLSRLRSASSQTIHVEHFDPQVFSGKTAIALDHFHSILEKAAELRLKLSERYSLLDDIHSDLKHSRKLIKNLVEEDKPKLLSYQLQYAYYKVQQKNLKETLDLLKTHEQEILRALSQNLPLIASDAQSEIDEKLLAVSAEIEKTRQEKMGLEINLEKALIEESAKVDYLNEKTAAKSIQYQQEIKTKVTLQIQKSLYLLQEQRNKDFFDIMDDTNMLIKSISKEEQPLYMEQVAVLRDLAKETFGSAKLFFGASLYETIEIVTALKDSFSTPLFVYNEQPISVLSLLKILAWIIIGFLLGAFYKRWIARVSRRWPNMSQMSVRLASNMGYYFIIMLTFIIAIGSVGIDMTSISLIAGALSIGIGFGLQTVVSNLIAGIILMFERTIRIGDTIEISDMLRGRVTDMRIRSTTIKTFDNVDIVVPNSSFIQNNVINWTLEDLTRRLHIPFGVAYGSDIEEVKKVILDELEQSDLKYIRYDKEKRPEIWMVAMNNSSVDFELLVWIEWDNKLRPNSFKSDFLILIYNALNKYGIQIPFPQLDLHVKNMPSETLK